MISPLNTRYAECHTSDGSACSRDLRHGFAAVLARKIHDSPQRHREHREISRIDERQLRTLHLFRQTKKRVNFIFFLVFSVISVSLW
jgi:hypothetical protein